MASDLQRHATVLAEMELFDPPAPLQDNNEAALAIGHWLRLADEVMLHDEERDPAEYRSSATRTSAQPLNRPALAGMKTRS